MTDKKNIERLFQEKFKDFEVNPAPEAWENIAARLEKKENKKRIFPFWFNAKAAGIAAALVLGFFGLHNYSNLFTWTLNSDSTTNETVVVQQDNNTSKPSKSEKTVATSTESNLDDLSSTQKMPSVATTSHAVVNANDDANHNHKSNQIVNSSSQVNTKEKTRPSNSYKNIQPSVKYLNNANEVFVVTEKSKTEKTTKTKSEASLPNQSSLALHDKEIFQKKKSTTTDVTSISNEKERLVKNQSAPTVKNTAIASKNTVPDENRLEKIGKEKIAESESENTIKNNPFVVSNGKALFQPNKKTSIDNTAISNVKDLLDGNQNATIVAIEKNKAPVEGNNNLADVMNKNNTTITSNVLSKAVVAVDSSKTTAIEENPLEKILREKEAEKLAKTTEDKKEKKKSDWLIKPTVAPIFMFAKNGSPIDEKFSDNSKSYNNTFSVGIGLEKRLSDKFYFRTSVNNLDLSYNTNDIAYYSTLNFSNPSARGMGNISVNQSALFTTIVDSRDAAFDGGEVLQNKKEGYLNQRISYVEIPFEVSYKLVDKKLGIQVMTGLSTLFLNKNQVSLVAEKFSSDLGEANNLNIIHFSTNIGLGFKYKFFKSFEASVEPTLKYQLFTFHTNAGGFKPYIVGLYSGVSYRF